MKKHGYLWSNEYLYDNVYCKGCSQEEDFVEVKFSQKITRNSLMEIIRNSLMEIISNYLMEIISNSLMEIISNSLMEDHYG